MTVDEGLARSTHRFALTLSTRCLGYGEGRTLFSLLFLATAFGNVSLGLMHRTYGVDLTPDFAIVPTLRRRDRWVDVQEVVRYTSSNCTSAVRLILAKGEMVTLR